MYSGGVNKTDTANLERNWCGAVSSNWIAGFLNVEVTFTSNPT